ncbi:MAG TPA: helix-turn-helix domain-containing protein [Gemmatimonadaceae bacterium]
MGAFTRPSDHLLIARSSPPYRELEPLLPVPERCTAPLPLGSVLVVQVHDAARDGPLVERCVPLLRARHPAAPVVLHFVNVSASGAVHLARRSAFLFVRAILVDDEPFAPTLRRIITHPADLAGDLVEWLPLCGVRVPPECVPLVREVVRRASAHRSVGELLHEIGESEHNARKRLHGRGLPSPSSWFQAARAIQAALRLQADAEHTLLDVALELGYSDHSTLSRQMVRLFGLRPGVVRELLGWEPLTYRWITRARDQREPNRLDRAIATGDGVG